MDSRDLDSKNRVGTLRFAQPTARSIQATLADRSPEAGAHQTWNTTASAKAVRTKVASGVDTWAALAQRRSEPIPRPAVRREIGIQS